VFGIVAIVVLAVLAMTGTTVVMGA